jgi:hypothetical protein
VAAPLPVDAPRSPARLSDRCYVVLVLRLLVDRQDHLIYGEVGGIDEGEAEERWVHFRGPDGLPGAVQTWLEHGLHRRSRPP